MAAVKRDENVPDSVAGILRAAGHDVVLARDQQLTGASDDQILAVAAGEGRVLISLDRGLGNVIQHPPGATAGVVVLRLGDQTFPRIRDVAGTLAHLLTVKPIAGRLWVLSDSRLRIWPRDSD